MQPARNTTILNLEKACLVLTVSGAVTRTSSSTTIGDADKLGMVHRPDHEGGFDLVRQHGLDQRRRRVGVDLDVDLRIGRCVSREDRRQSQRRRRFERADRDPAARHRAVGGGLLRFADQSPDPLRIGQELRARAGQADAAGVAMEKRHAELGFEQPDALGHVRLHGVELAAALVMPPSRATALKNARSPASIAKAPPRAITLI